MINACQEISISLLSSLSIDLDENKPTKARKSIVIGISTSNVSTNTAFLARKILSFYESNDLKTILINAVVDGNEMIIPSEITDNELSFSASKEKITYSSGKELINGLKDHYQIILIALDKLTQSIPSLIFGSCCEGIVLFETKDISNTTEIDKVLECIEKINVKPLGFVLG